jgi:hypothetical protein
LLVIKLTFTAEAQRATWLKKNISAAPFFILHFSASAASLRGKLLPAT